MSAYQDLVDRLERISGVSQASGVLRWDQETMMPEGGTEARALQLSVLDGLSHEMFTADAVGRLLDQAEKEASAPEQEALLREARRAWERATRVPGDLVEALSQASSRALEAWVKARGNDDFGTFAPHLERLLELSRQKAEHIDPDRDPYEVLYEGYEPWLPWDRARPLIDELRAGIQPLIDRAPDPGTLADPFTGTWPVAQQEALSRRILDQLGYDFQHGRLDVSAHPFSTGNPYDARITTRYDERAVLSALTSTIHECGHAMYTQGLPTEHFGTPLGDDRDLVVHESQSRLWENHVARSRPFWRWAVGAFQDVFGDRAADLEPEACFQAANVVEPSLIRVEADELTYHAHIALRVEIEEALVQGDLEVAEAPQRWDELSERYLGLRPPDDAQGVLQDVHWSHGAFGYFPTYSLGSMLAAQLFEVYADQADDVDQAISQGRFGDLLAWLRAEVHQHGARYTTPDLIERATGKPLSEAPFLAYAEQKFPRAWNAEL